MFKKIFTLSVIGILISFSISCNQKEIKTYYCAAEEGGVCNPNKDKEQDARLDDLNERLNNLTNSFNSTVATVNVLSGLVATLDASHYQAQIDAMNAQIGVLQSQATVIQSQVTTLSVQENVVEYIDVCGPKPGSYNEILLKTASGRYIAFFESGGSRFLTILSPGNFMTTDGTGCYFTINSSGALVNEHY